jgi:hypothetical protein
MIVIPPSSAQEGYFTDLAEQYWKITMETQNELCVKLKSENNTLVVTCKIDIEGNMESSFNLHYRYFKNYLYCFIEEGEPVEKCCNTHTD